LIVSISVKYKQIVGTVFVFIDNSEEEPEDVKCSRRSMKKSSVKNN
jgi:hypothetical protein